MTNEDRKRVEFYYVIQYRLENSSCWNDCANTKDFSSKYEAIQNIKTFKEYADGCPGFAEIRIIRRVDYPVFYGTKGETQSCIEY